ncbi:MAG: DUF3372 domain-containing protein, partial [Anaerolineales bacterium]|nr:DUF3372 domain-containing protein [Anaerolineales bacterium]
QTFAPQLGALDFVLHPVQQASVDAVVQTASYAEGAFTVPARTTAVFVTYRPEAAPEEAVVVAEETETAEPSATPAATATAVSTATSSAPPATPTAVTTPDQLPETMASNGLLIVLALLAMGIGAFAFGFMRRDKTGGHQ